MGGGEGGRKGGREREGREKRRGGRGGKGGEGEAEQSHINASKHNVAVNIPCMGADATT